MTNKKNIQKLLFSVVLLIGISATSSGQYDPLYSQYMFNIQAYNPAYVGSTNSLSLMALGRQQWLGFVGAPQTHTFSVQSPLRNNKVGVGLTLINDKIGMINRLSTNADYSYKIKISNKSTLQLGLKGGFTYYQHSLNNYIMVDQNDQLILNDIDQTLMLNAGVGAYLYSDEYYLGFSVPKMLNNEVGDNMNRFEVNNMYLIAGLSVNMGKSIQFKPSINARYNYSTFVTDINAGFVYFERFGIGGIYRVSDAFGFGVFSHLKLTKQITLGYAYDFTNDSSINTYNSGSHEIMVRFEFSSEKTNYTTPQFF